MRFKKLLVATLAVYSAICMAPQTLNAQQTMTNGDVIKLAGAKLGDDIIIGRIKVSKCAFDTSTDGLIALKQAGVNDAVIGAMAACTTAMAPAGDANDPLAPHESGIYLLSTGTDGKTAMTELEQANYQGSKMGGEFTSRLTHGITKVKIIAVIPGPTASIRSASPTPTFYFYFDVTATGLSGRGAGSQISDPNQFTLIKLDMNAHNRQTTVGAENDFGQSLGADEKSVMAFKTERTRAGMYKVTVTSPLAPGEYCFVASAGASRGTAPGVSATVAGGAGAGQALEIFDFGIGGGQ